MNLNTLKAIVTVKMVNSRIFLYPKNEALRPKKSINFILISFAIINHLKFINALFEFNIIAPNR
jgi:hypothetical protein